MADAEDRLWKNGFESKPEVGLLQSGTLSQGFPPRSKNGYLERLYVASGAREDSRDS